MYVLWNLTIRSYCCANCYDDAQIILKQCYKRDFVYYKKGDDKRRSGFSRNLPELGLIFHTLNWPSDWRLRTPSPKNVAYSKKRLRKQLLPPRIILKLRDLNCWKIKKRDDKRIKTSWDRKIKLRKKKRKGKIIRRTINENIRIRWKNWFSFITFS